MSLPDSKEKWLSVAKEFEEKWQFPNCVGAIDGKHVPLINLSIMARHTSIIKAFSVLYCWHWLTPTIRFCMSM